MSTMYMSLRIFFMITSLHFKNITLALIDVVEDIYQRLDNSEMAVWIYLDCFSAEAFILMCTLEVCYDM